MRGQINIIKKLSESDRDKMLFLNEMACDYHGINKLVPFTKSRQKEVVYIRKAVYHVFSSYKSNSATLEKIGKFYNQDHTTVLHALKTSKELLFYEDFENLVNYLERKHFDKYISLRDGVFYNKSRVNNDLKRLAFLGI